MTRTAPTSPPTRWRNLASSAAYLPAGLRLAAWLLGQLLRTTVHRGAHRIGATR